MAEFALIDVSLTFNAVNLSTKVRKATIKAMVEELDSTAYGGGGYHARLGGLKDWSLEVEFNQDFAAAQVDATLFPLLGSVFTVTGKPTSGANAATNPQYSGPALLKEYTPIDGEVGSLATATASFLGAGTLSRLTS